MRGKERRNEGGQAQQRQAGSHAWRLQARRGPRLPWVFSRLLGHCVGAGDLRSSHHRCSAQGSCLSWLHDVPANLQVDRNSVVMVSIRGERARKCTHCGLRGDLCVSS